MLYQAYSRYFSLIMIIFFISEWIPMSSKQHHSMHRANMISEFCDEVGKILSDIASRSQMIINDNLMMLLSCATSLYMKIIAASFNVIYLNKSKYRNISTYHCLFLWLTVMPTHFFAKRLPGNTDATFRVKYLNTWNIPV